ncbi:MAG: epoxyqueuosine reductase [Bradymonadia bacterium]|jgi:epoxyqueuosine reductase
MIASLIKERAAELGFVRCAIVPVGPASHFEHLESWLADGLHGEMEYMERNQHIRANTAELEPWARSVVVVAAPYHATEATSEYAERWARYCVGDDYHGLLWYQLEALAAFIRAETGSECRSRPATDSAPILERNLAVDSGVGWMGKSTMVLSQGVGSYFFLAELFVSIDLEESRSEHPDRCGHCTMCIDQCPTGAIVAPYRVDARRCISYLTIEQKGPIPREMRSLIGGHLFGCDICQSVCPWNSKDSPPAIPEFQPRPELVQLDAAALLRCTQEDFSRIFKDSSVKRTRRKGLARNAAVVLGNSGDRTWIGELAAALRGHEYELVRGHAAWALGALGGQSARSFLELSVSDESAYVREEIRAALEVTRA